MKTIKEAKEITGGLSNPSKMPGKSYSIPATTCKTGTKLHKIKGSVCEGCYALKGAYAWPNVQDALKRRFDALKDERWVNAMALLINQQSKEYFRWHDSGDLQSVEHLKQIVEVCKLTPATKHWLPTREYVFVQDYLLKYGALPDNLTIRLSAHKVNFTPPKKLAKRIGVQTSDVITGKRLFNDAGDYECPSRHQENKCMDCRACWDKSVDNVSYFKH